MADERDPKVSGRYRELGAEQPPRALDDAILAASRRAVRKRAWYGPVALAASLVMVIAVTLQVERQKPVEEQVAAAPAEARKEREAQTFATPAAPESPKPGLKPRQAPQPFTPEPPPASAPAPQAAEAPRELAKQNEPAAATQENRTAEAAAGARARSDSARDSVAAAPAMRREMGSAEKLGQLQSKVETPDAWLERIAELRKQGKHEEADKALAEFRQRYPDYRMNDEVKAKVERK